MSIQIVEIAQPSVIDTVTVAQPSTVAVVEVRQGPAGTGGGGSNSVTSATTSDGTADLSLLNLTTATAEVTGTLTANHIHGNLAGNVYAHVRAGEALLKGDPVYVSGSHGSGSTLIAIVSKADAGNAAKMPAVGIMDANLANNATGHMVIVGTITELNTAGYSINAELYVAAGGGMTATPPTARAQPVARVERSNASNGAILVKVNGLSASDATASTLVRRDASGGSTFLELYANAAFIGDLNTSGGIQADGPIIAEAAVTFQATSPITFDSTSYTYGAGAASAHRTALGSGATGDALFQAASASAARTTLGFDAAVPKIPITFSNSSDFTTASTSFVDVTGLSFPVAANKNYKVDIFLSTNKTDAAGMAVQLTGPASPARLWLRVDGSAGSLTAATFTTITAFSSPTNTFNTVAADGFLNTYGRGIIQNGANAGTVQLQLRAVTSGTAKIYAGSTIVVTEL